MPSRQARVAVTDASPSVDRLDDNSAPTPRNANGRGVQEGANFKKHQLKKSGPPSGTLEVFPFR